MNKVFIFLIVAVSVYLMNSGCAQIGMPTGGAKDTLAPVLVRATPPTRSINFRDNKISLTFDEYVELKDITSNILVSPLQKNNPTITWNLRTVSIKLKDTLLPNTTYTINFGDAIRDINEGNVLPNYTYTFSTGPLIDSLTLSGKVILAETGLADSTMIVMLYRNTHDTAVQKLKPDYITRLARDGSYTFENIPASSFNIYALKDGDGGKTYNSKTEPFAFLDNIISTPRDSAVPTLYAYEEQKSVLKTPVLRPPVEKRLRYTTNLVLKTQDILQPLEITFNNSIKTLDTQRIVLSDTNYKALPALVTVDSTRKKITIQASWVPDQAYALIIPKDGLSDTVGNTLLKNDTLRFTTRKTSDYGTVVLRFRNLDLAKNPLILFTENNIIKFSYPLTSNEWSNRLFPPGEYDLRIVYDDNKNGKWDPGNYELKKQPEKGITLTQKLSVRADWDNEREIVL